MTTDSTLLRPIIRANVRCLSRRRLAMVRRQLSSVAAATARRVLVAADHIITTGEVPS
jgi:hypothetical protein